MKNFKEISTMRGILPEKLLRISEKCPEPLYVVGGAARDFLSGAFAEQRDIDLASPMDAESFCRVLQDCGMSPSAVYRHTGTVKFEDGAGNDFEFAAFRSDKYIRGEHTPTETFFTKDISLDARRRDFTANAVYYDIGKDEFLDPLGGIADISAKKLRTVDSANKVFGEDGLRLMRLCRQAGQLGFSPTEDCLSGARENAALVKDIAPERIFAELRLILHADEKYGVKDGHYRGLSLLRETGVLKEILPELALGDGLAQRADFHRYDVLEHTFKAVLYAPPSARFAALLHDVGKPYAVQKDGNTHYHEEYGGKIAREILTRLKAPEKLKDETQKLVELHMYDFDCKVKLPKLRRFFVRNFEILEPLMLLKQADFSGCKDDLSPCPTNLKWQAELERMKEEGAPLIKKQLALSGRDILALDGIEPKYVSRILDELLLHAAVFPKDNQKERLFLFAKQYLKEMKK